MQVKTFGELKRNLKRPASNLNMIRVALLGDTATQFLGQALRGMGMEHGLDLLIWEADFDQIERQIFDGDSELYKFKPEIVIVFLATHKLLGKHSKLDRELQAEFAATQAELIVRIHKAVDEELQAKLVLYNFPEID